MNREKFLRSLFVAAALLAFTAGWFAIRNYYGRYYGVLASRGVMDEREHAARLERSLSYDPSYGYSRLLRADYLMKKGRLQEAEIELRTAMESSRPAQAYLLQGVLFERRKRPADAVKAYEHVLAVAPAQVTALERLGVLAYETGDLKRVEEMAGQITRADLNNPNPTYLRAVAAERAGDPAAAYRYYQRLSAAGQPREGALYDLDTVRSRLQALEPVVQKL